MICLWHNLPTRLRQHPNSSDSRLARRRHAAATGFAGRRALCGDVLTDSSANCYDDTEFKRLFSTWTAANRHRLNCSRIAYDKQISSSNL